MLSLSSLIWLLVWQIAVTSAQLEDHRDSTRTTLPPQHFSELGSQRLSVEYGTYEIPSRSEDEGMRQIGARIDPPCSDCLVTFMQAELKYANGTTADADTGMWMHHVVFLNMERADGVCHERPRGQRFFASGNERTPFDLSVGGAEKLGYRLGPNDTVILTGEMMNMRSHVQEVVVSAIWEFVPSTAPGFVESMPFWLDIGGCSDSNKRAIPDAQFEFSSKPVTMNFTGRIASIGGHLHDGGTNLEILKNGERICNTEATYGGSAGSQHIVQMSICQKAVMVLPGDKLSLSAHYDTAKHAPMLNNDGSLEPVMGIALLYCSATATTRDWRLLHFLLTFIALPSLLVAVVGAIGVYLYRRTRADLWPKWMPQRRAGWKSVAIDEPEEEQLLDDDRLQLSPLVKPRGW